MAGTAFSDDDDDDDDDDDRADVAEQYALWDSVIRVYCTHSDPDFHVPWQRSRQYASTSSGFVVRIEGVGLRIMTNAHAVEYGRIIQVRRRGDDMRRHTAHHGAHAKSYMKS